MPDPTSAPTPATLPATGPQTAIGVTAIALGGLLALGATHISSDAGYAGVGPNFLPWLVAGVLTLCGAWLIFEARTGGWRALAAPSGAARGDWPALAWVGAGIAANAALLTTLGFILSCTLCFMLAARAGWCWISSPAS